MRSFQTNPAAPFLFFYPAAAAAAFLAGAGPGLAAILFGAIFALLFFPGPSMVASWIALAILGPLFAFGSANLRLLLDERGTLVRELASFKFIGDNAGDWILLLDEAGNIRYANRRACADLGWTGEELAGRAIESLASESQRPALRAHLEAAQSTEVKPIEVTFESAGKRPALVELSCTGVRTKDDYVIYATARDVGERKRLELERRRNEQNRQEVRRWESLGVLAGGLAHDFNNLLTTILGYSSLAKDCLPEGHEALAMLDGIASAAERSAPSETNAAFEEGGAGDGKCLGIAVEDRGCGMTAEVLARAFDPFFSTKFPGRGLGLPAVRGIVRAYSGKLLLETAPGRGTRVEVWLAVEKTKQPGSL